MLKYMPEISKIRVDGDSFFATVDGEEIRITTFRESLWRQHKVYLPPPFTDACSPQTICCDSADSWSDPMQVPGCIHDPWTAAKMADFARGRLSNGVYEKTNAEVLDEHCRFFPALHRALADPNTADRLPRIQQCRTIGDFQAYWKTLYYLLHALMGWDRIGDGLAWWYASGRNALGDARLELVNAIWDDDGQLDYFAAHCWRGGFSGSHPEELSPAEMAMTSPWRDEDWWRHFKRQGRRFPHDPFYCGSNPLHLDAGCCLTGTSEKPPVVWCADNATRRATLVVGDFPTWRDALETFGNTLPPDSQRSWHADVFDRWVGHLGVFRRSRVTGRWFQGKHSVHMRGHGQELGGIGN
jgi:hypothetical protein